MIVKYKQQHQQYQIIINNLEKNHKINKELHVNKKNYLKLKTKHVSNEIELKNKNLKIQQLSEKNLKYMEEKKIFFYKKKKKKKF